MATTVTSLQAVFRADISPLQQGIAQATRHLSGFAAGVAATLQTPTTRAAALQMGTNIIAGLDQMWAGSGGATGWTARTVVDPLSQSLHGEHAGLQTGASALSGSLLSGMRAGVGDMGAWTNTTVVSPFTAGLGRLTPAVAAAVAGVTGQWTLLKNTLGGAWGAVQPALTALQDGIGGVVGGIGSLIDDAIGKVNEFISALGNIQLPDLRLNMDTGGGNEALAQVVAPPMQGQGGLMGAAFREHQRGTSWTGSGAANQIAGIVHHREAVVPHGGLQVIPSPRGLLIEGVIGAGGGAAPPALVLNQPVFQIHGVQDVEALFDALRQVAARRGR